MQEKVNIKHPRFIHAIKIPMPSNIPQSSKSKELSPQLMKSTPLGKNANKRSIQLKRRSSPCLAISMVPICSSVQQIDEMLDMCTDSNCDDPNLLQLLFEYIDKTDKISFLSKFQLQRLFEFLLKFIPHEIHETPRSFINHEVIPTVYIPIAKTANFLQRIAESLIHRVDPEAIEHFIPAKLIKALVMMLRTQSIEEQKSIEQIIYVIYERHPNFIESIYQSMQNLLDGYIDQAYSFDCVFPALRFFMRFMTDHIRSYMAIPINRTHSTGVIESQGSHLESLNGNDNINLKNTNSRTATSLNRVSSMVNLINNGTNDNKMHITCGFNKKYVNLFKNSIFPLYSTPFLSEFSNSLVHIIDLFLSKDNSLYPWCFNYILQHWPKTNSSKKCIFLYLIITILSSLSDDVKDSIPDSIKNKLFIKFNENFNSINFKIAFVCIEASKCEHFMRTFFYGPNGSIYYKVVLDKLRKATTHWSYNVSGIAKTVLNKYIDFRKELKDLTENKENQNMETHPTFEQSMTEALCFGKLLNKNNEIEQLDEKLKETWIFIAKAAQFLHPQIDTSHVENDVASCSLSI